MNVCGDSWPLLLVVHSMGGAVGSNLIVDESLSVCGLVSSQRISTWMSLL
jgi:alpha-beta hydrolase superfamily lysophospholipase